MFRTTTQADNTPISINCHHGQAGTGEILMAAAERSRTKLTRAAQAAFASAVQTARLDHDWSQEYVGALVGVSQAAVASWENEVSVPEPHMVFQLESKLGLRAGQLSQHLGYLPLNAAGAKPARAEVVEAILRDQRLTPDLKAVLVATYRSMISFS